MPRKYSDILTIIVTYNPDASFFDNNLLLPDVRYLIVDNSESVNQWFLDKINDYPNVSIISNGENLGIGKALNIGCEYAIAHGFKFAVTMDQDSLLTENILCDLLSYYLQHQKDKLAIISPKHTLLEDINQNKSKCNKSINGILTMTSGNFLVLEVWKKLDGFNEKLFIDMVDIDFYIRAIMAGLQVITLPNTVMRHHLGASETRYFLFKTVTVLNHNPMRKYYQIRNFCYVLDKYKNFELTDMSVIKKFGRNLAIKVILYERQKIKKLWYMLRGYLDFKRRKFGRFGN